MCYVEEQSPSAVSGRGSRAKPNLGVCKEISEEMLHVLVRTLNTSAVARAVSFSFAPPKMVILPLMTAIAAELLGVERLPAASCDPSRWIRVVVAW